MERMSYPEKPLLPEGKLAQVAALSKSVEREHLHRAHFEQGYGLTTVRTPRPESDARTGVDALVI